MNFIKRFFKEDIPAAFSAGKWRIGLMQLRSRLKQLEKQRNALITELGTKAWSARVRHEGYETLYAQLVELDGLASQAQQELDSLQIKIAQETDHLNTTKAEFNTRLNDLKEPRQAAFQKLTQLQSAQKSIELRLTQFQKTVDQGPADLQRLEALMGQTSASNQPDKEAKIASLQNTIRTLEAHINEVLVEINTARVELASNQAEQMPIAKGIEGHDQGIALLEGEKKSVQEPIQEQLDQLNLEYRKTNGKRTNLTNNIASLMSEFGDQVFKTRPNSEKLLNEYSKIDSAESEKKEIIVNREFKRPILL